MYLKILFCDWTAKKQFNACASKYQEKYQYFTEKKLSRTRKMSEAIQSPERVGGKTPKLMRIPTEIGDITRDWARLIVNQYMLKNDRDLLRTNSDIMNFEVLDCKESAGDFSCTCSMNVTIRSPESAVGYLRQ